MIYFDNSATTLMKPPEVSQAVAYAIDNFGNAGRSFYDAVLRANREIFNTRMEIAKLIGLDEPLNVAFTSSATESLNLVISGLINREDSVITTVTEHNSVLRPLYLTGCELSFLDCDDNGILLLGSFDELVKQSTKFLVCTHGSNVTGNITDVNTLYEKCKEFGITMILDISQTFGTVPVDINTADIFCFTGHKGLYGPQGTGGIILNREIDFRIKKAGGAGANSFDRFQSNKMPDIFEAGTQNSHGIYGLQKGVIFINETGIDTISGNVSKLAEMFYEGVKDIGGIKVYGDFSSKYRLPIVSVSSDKITSSELAERLWSDHSIAVRAGSHCAPLLHKRFKTEQSGLVRFSFSSFNTEKEVLYGINALNIIIRSAG